MQFTLAARDDLDSLGADYSEHGSVSVKDFLPNSQASALREELRESNDWHQIFRVGGEVLEMPDRAYQALAQDKRDDLRTLVWREAAKGLQYRYRSIRASDDVAERVHSASHLNAFTSFLNSSSVLQLLRRLTGNDQIDLVDAQATSFSSENFLTSHDDDVEGKNRVAAYVFGLTRTWQADWGGLLLLEDGKRVAGYVPDFNALRIFTVPQRHHVSMVAPWVEEDRLSVTGWLRTSGKNRAI